MLYPLRFRPVYRPYLWGGRSFARWRASVPSGPLAESWEVSCHPDGVSVVVGGTLDRLTLPEVIARHGEALLGRDVLLRHGDRFPLLVKFIDTAQPLSVQVHPGDDVARRLEGGGLGKSEMWYVVEARPGATAVAGLRPGTTREALSEALDAGDPAPLLRVVPVRAGDVVDIPAGLVHAAGSGLVLYELQQGGDLAYRLHDYGRKDAAGRLRPLQIPKALEAIDFGAPVRLHARPHPLRRVSDGSASGEVHRRILRSGPGFAAEEWTLARGSTLRFLADGNRFRILTAVEGDGTLRYEDERGRPVAMPFGMADTVLVPAALGPAVLEGPLKVVQAVPV